MAFTTLVKTMALTAVSVLTVGCQLSQRSPSAHSVSGSNACMDPTVGLNAANKDPVLSVEEIKVLASEPTDIGRLLENIKVISDRDLLVQPLFYDESVLKKFFGVSAVRWTVQPEAVFSASTSGPVRQAELTGNGSGLTGVTVDLQTHRTCVAKLPENARPGYKPPLQYRHGYLHVHIKGMPEATVGTVRAIFGPYATETEGFCENEEGLGLGGYCVPNNLNYTQHDKEREYPLPFWRHYVEFVTEDSPEFSSDRRTVRFSDGSKIVLITIYQFEDG
jgi:hypothetical protein